MLRMEMNRLTSAMAAASHMNKKMRLTRTTSLRVTSMPLMREKNSLFALSHALTGAVLRVNGRN